MKRIDSQKGYTLTELLVVMTIFLIIIMVSAQAFDRIVSQSSQLRKVSETNIEGIIGLEVLRRDLESIGYGLPWDFATGITYGEVADDVGPDFPVQGIDPKSFNDSPSNVPRAVLSEPSTSTSKIIDANAGVPYWTNPGSDYLVIKSVSVPFTKTSKKWSYVNYSSSGGSNTSSIRQWSSTEENFQTDDRVITLVSSFADAPINRQLAMVSATDFSYKIDSIYPGNDAYKPKSRTVRPSDNASITNDMYVAYGVNSISGSDNIRMPFNRSDYYVQRPKSNMTTTCNKGTGILYKAVVYNSTSASGGQFPIGAQYPLLDCVGDMQVVYELDRSGVKNSGDITYMDTLTGMTAQEIREQLRTIRVYILGHEGKKDLGYSYPYTDVNKVVVVSDPSLSSSGRIFSKTDMVSYFGADWFNYRWKVYTIAIKPKNLNN